MEHDLYTVLSPATLQPLSHCENNVKSFQVFPAPGQTLIYEMSGGEFALAGAVWHGAYFGVLYFACSAVDVSFFRVKLSGENMENC